MARATWFFAGTSVLGFATAGWMYLQNRSLAEDLRARDKLAVTAVDPKPSNGRDPFLGTPSTRGEPIPQRPGAQPALPELPTDTRLERRVRRSEEFAAMFGRNEGETPEDYKARVIPLIKAGLLVPRSRAEDNRKEAEAKAHVTPEQSKALDAAFDKVYGDVLDYANKAIADGTLSPYERNVSGWLEVAGGLGTMLGNTNQMIGKILDPDQVKALSGAGFEWGEYLGAMAPWENLSAPPPPPKPR